MTRQYFRFGMKTDLRKIVLEKPPKLPKMRKEKITCDCGKQANKFQESPEYKWFICRGEDKVISIRKEVKSEVLSKS